jgi:hypothetical protein
MRKVRKTFTLLPFRPFLPSIVFFITELALLQNGAPSPYNSTKAFERSLREGAPEMVLCPSENE